MRAKAPLLLILMFVLAIAAGVVAGKLAARVQPGPGNVAPIVRRETLADELQLSAAQREQMKEIWQNVRDESRDYESDARKAQREYEDAVVKLLNDEQRAKYAQLTQASKQRVTDLDAKRKAAFQRGVRETEKMLSEPQRKAYERIIQDRLGTLAGTTGPDVGKGMGIDQL